jgi:hypothetical protein
MKHILALLLVFTMAVNAYASSAQWEQCCPDAPCAMADCSAMGCLPAIAPMLPTPELQLVVSAWVHARHVTARQMAPSHHADIWTPPD